MASQITGRKITNWPALQQISVICLGTAPAMDERLIDWLFAQELSTYLLFQVTPIFLTMGNA